MYAKDVERNYINHFLKKQNIGHNSESDDELSYRRNNSTTSMQNKHEEVLSPYQAYENLKRVKASKTMK